MNNADLQKLVRGIDDTINSFWSTVKKDNLYCIANCKAAFGGVNEIPPYTTFGNFSSVSQSGHPIQGLIPILPESGKDSEFGN